MKQQKFVLEVSAGYEVNRKWLEEVIRTAVADKSRIRAPYVGVTDVSGEGPALMTRAQFVDKVALLFGMSTDKKLVHNPSETKLAERAISQGIAERELKRITDKLETSVSNIHERMTYYKGLWDWLVNHATWRQRRAFYKDGYSLCYDRWFDASREQK